jgi:hypothetical protein
MTTEHWTPTTPAEGESTFCDRCGKTLRRGQIMYVPTRQLHAGSERTELCPDCWRQETAAR